MDEVVSDTIAVQATLADLERVRGRGRLVALAAVEIVIADLPILVSGFRVIDLGDRIAVEPPTFRDHCGKWRDAVALPGAVLTAAAELIRDALATAP